MTSWVHFGDILGTSCRYLGNILGTFGTTLGPIFFFSFFPFFSSLCYFSSFLCLSYLIFSFFFFLSFFYFLSFFSFFSWFHFVRAYFESFSGHSYLSSFEGKPSCPSGRVQSRQGALSVVTHSNVEIQFEIRVHNIETFGWKKRKKSFHFQFFILKNRNNISIFFILAERGGR